MSTVSIIMQRDGVPQRKCGWAFIPDDCAFGVEVATAKALADACGCPRFQTAMDCISDYGCEFFIVCGDNKHVLTQDDMRYAWANRRVMANGFMHRPTSNLEIWVDKNA